MRPRWVSAHPYFKTSKKLLKDYEMYAKSNLTKVTEGKTKRKFVFIVTVQ